MVKTIGRVRIAKWRHIFKGGGGAAISWNGKRFLFNIEFWFEDRRRQQ